MRPKIPILSLADVEALRNQGSCSASGYIEVDPRLTLGERARLVQIAHETNDSDIRRHALKCLEDG